ncbi:MAG: MFS transporter [Opitutaceae bacterium]|nr:MFS transporter [Verrucomicrobiales bacterium]
MTARQIKAGYFVLTGLNSVATTYYFYYLFFLMEKQFGFGNLGNLFLSACNGLVYMFAAWFGGRFGQRHGYNRALRIGFSAMIAAMISGCFVSSVIGQFVVMIVWTLGMCFTWPTLEALVSEKESPAGLQQMIGIYNLVWAGCAALAYLVGGYLFDHLGPSSIFILPALVHGVQLILLFWLQCLLPPGDSTVIPEVAIPVVSDHEAERHRSLVPPETFLKMAWLANPFAYVAINTVVAVIPGLAKKLELSPTYVGLFCSVWFFARLAAFLGLWLWTGWHYRFRWFVGAYLALIIAFAIMLLVPSLAVIVAAQIGFGAALGLIYYSSLFYSMDVGEAKGEHGGFHESALGAGIFLGPATGAAALHLFPGQAGVGTLAVCGLLVAGFAGVLFLRFKPK